ncbi:MAG: 4-hydroxy-tetrahydrodipicolinate reductase, partial [Planctomycetes bacterium]|nr:4-hydroxy-tetrahydrodipicolinate reductase [Planctomycetota bacterium]
LRAEAGRLGVGGVIAPNFAIGAVLMIELAAKAARFLDKIEIIELHHAQKIDVPSGTALRTRERLQKSLATDATIPIHSVRLPGFLAHQEVMLSGLGECLTIRHDTSDRRCYMPGVLLAIRRAPVLRELVIGLENLIDL